MDANRPIEEAACGDFQAERAWREYHDFIRVAEEHVTDEYPKGWCTDIHGHGHAIQRLEIGYNVSANSLRQADAVLDTDTADFDASSFPAFVRETSLSFPGALRGPTALGTLFANAGRPATPSQPDPAPAVGDPYFNGGYSTEQHGCMNGGRVCGLQISAT